MIALFGGTFDPVHRGHLHLAKSLQENYQFQRFFLVPNSQNPLKSSATDACYRLEMVRRAVANLNDKRFEVLDWEALAPPPSFTVDTLERMREEYGHDITLVIGNDVFRDFARWHEPKKILQWVHILIVQRDKDTINPQAILGPLDITLAQDTPRKWTCPATKNKIEIFTFKPLPYAATQLREEIKEKWRKNDLALSPPGIEDSVWALIKEKRIYSVT